jgi:hypothetical protein
MLDCIGYALAMLMLLGAVSGQQRTGDLPLPAVTSSAEGPASSASLTQLCLTPPQRGECRGSFVRYFL